MTDIQTLQSVDQALIHLLQKRVALLQESDTPSIAAQLADVQPLLSDVGISEFTWKTLITNCMAMLATDTPTQPQKRSDRRQVTIVGGRGAMGKLFCEQFTATGHAVSIMEYNDWDRADILLGQADLVLLCVPLKSTAALARQVGQHLSPHTVLADIASTKVEVMQAMLESHSGPVVGLHPMFGPGVTSLLGQKVVICEGQQMSQCQWVLDWIKENGGNLIPATPEEHDSMMVAVQAIRFFSNFSLGTFYAEEGVDIERSFEFSSPLYRSEINTISRLVAQDAALYVDILLASDERRAAVGRLVDTYARLAQLIEEGDRAALIAEFEKTRNSFRDGAERSLAESNYMLNNLSRFLAAHDAESRIHESEQRSLPCVNRATKPTAKLGKAA
ncbi:MAG: bifunctional chorismate mutase/prephenate dehydrogenase [Leptolyngbya sp. DLM2.Bin15]|nr:MAG: bifunctional chorismate mutase/prephenate dehydrogenase [Leptolyngbya sp. DLM2.Bin15]